jgi:endonuclease/exonuclease/phosphatase family metal-dependent hydrolase
LPLVIRSWNVFHGNAVPPEREAHVEEMVRLVTQDRPDVLCLQEVPPWALAHLGEWSAMQAFGDIAARPTIGPLPSTAEIGRALTFHHGLLRSTFTGQANAILLDPRLRALDRNVITLNARSFRRAQARWLRLPLLTTLAWANERRVCQAVRFADGRHRTVLVANLHATGWPDRRVPDAELLRASTFADALARPQDVCVLAGDYNIMPRDSRTLLELSTPEWGFSAPGPGIDQILVRGAAANVPERWPRERRIVDGRVLSDHAPVEVTIE